MVQANFGGAFTLWPTPKAQDANAPCSHGEGGPGLQEAVAMEYWPTPRASNPGSRPNQKGGKILEEDVLIAEGLRKRGEKLWPTPTVQAANRLGGTKGRIHNNAPEDLVAAIKLEYKNMKEIEKLNPDWEELLMGFPPGWTDLDGPHSGESLKTLGSHPEWLRGYPIEEQE